MTVRYGNEPKQLAIKVILKDNVDEHAECVMSIKTRCCLIKINNKTLLTNYTVNWTEGGSLRNEPQKSDKLQRMILSGIKLN